MAPNAGAVKEGAEGAAARSSAEQFNYRRPGSSRKPLELLKPLGLLRNVA